MDSRLSQLAHQLIHYSTQLKADEKILIDLIDTDAEPLVRALVSEAYEVGAKPHVQITLPAIQRKWLSKVSDEELEWHAGLEQERMKHMDAYIAVRGAKNTSELADVPHDRMEAYEKKYIQPVHMQIRLPHTKWCVLRYPSPSMAQAAGKSTESFEDFFFQVCNLDYAKMDQAMTPLVELMEKTHNVRIMGPGTDLRFSIEGIPAVKCSGRRNIPDGEVYTAPVRNSVQGTLRYNTPSLYQGTVFENVTLSFKDGKIVHATANETEKLNHILDTDDGARYIGEFALGLNPFILQPMKDILFDEKICGSFHFTPGNAYTVANNGNASAIHWDLVCIQRPEYGGGEIYFDDQLIRKDGRFVIKDLEHLNPEHWSKI